MGSVLMMKELFRTELARQVRMMPPAMGELVRCRKQFDVIYVCGFCVLGVVAVVGARLLRKKTMLRAESCGEFAGDFVKQRSWPGVARSQDAGKMGPGRAFHI